MNMKRLFLAAALMACAATAFADSHECAERLTATALSETFNEANATSLDFKNALERMTLDTGLETSATIGATLMGSAVSNETAAIVQGLQHLVALRDVPLAEREAVVDELSRAMKDGALRMRRVAAVFDSVGRMTHSPEVQALAVDAKEQASQLARAWGCD